jgi:sec-independent protein translocase protein TatA
MPGDLFDSPLKILIIAVVIIVLFGSKKLPVAARSLGRSMRILKSEVSGLHDDDETDPETAAAARPVAPQQITAPAPVPAPAPVAAEEWATQWKDIAAQPATPAQPASQEQIDALQRQIRELKEASLRETASVPADQKPL